MSVLNFEIALWCSKFILFTSEQPNTVVNGDSVVMIDEGDSVTLNCTADGFPRPSIIWSRTGAVLNIGGRITKHEG